MDKRIKLKKLLAQYTPSSASEVVMVDQLSQFVHSDKKCFDNFNKVGHITASAWIVDPKAKKVGLIHHATINKWFQPGGHSDGNPDTPHEALREACEEFGIPDLELASEMIFDIDVHRIKEDKKRGLGEHFHYDVRFLVLGDASIVPSKSEESHEARWVSFDEAAILNDSESICRMIDKTRAMFQ